jgi:CRP/FNR family cyclic AMP-dependent transcriptional regulator
MDLIKTVDIFRNLSIKDINLLGTICRSLEVPAKNIILSEGEPSKGLFIVESGTVKVCKGPAGQFDSIALIPQGGHFGEISLVDEGPTSASVVTDEPVRLLFISRSHFNQLLDVNEPLAVKIYKNIARTLAYRLRKTSEVKAEK